MSAGSRDADRRADALLPGPAGRDHRPRRQSHLRRLHGLPDVDVRMAGDQHVRVVHGGHDPALLGARHQVVDQHAEPAAAGRAGTARTAAARSSMPSSGSTTTPSMRRSSPQIRSTRAASWMPSTQIRLALATCASYPGDRDRTRRRSAAAPLRRRRPDGLRRVTDVAVEQERGRRQREVAPLAVPVLQHHRAQLEADHRAAEARVHVLDHQVPLGVHLGHHLAPAPVHRRARPRHT